MNATMKMFDGFTIFLAVLAVGYGFLTGMSRTGVEWVGTTAFTLTAGLSLLIGAFLRFVSRRVSTLPEDYELAEVSDGSGELGFFSPHSYWPLMMGASILLTGYGAAFWNWWLVLGGALLIIGTSSALVFEYHWGREKH